MHGKSNKIAHWFFPIDKVIICIVGWYSSNICICMYNTFSEKVYVKK